MSTGFVKLYGSIIHSSIWNEPDNVRLVWVTMLAMSTYHGIVEASVGGIAHAARVSKEACEDALARLQAPDPDSRDGSTGERIRRVEGGWEIINHARYRDMRSPRQVKQAEYQRRYEAKLKGAQPEQSEKSEPQVRLSPSLSPSSSSSTSQSPSESGEGEHEREDAPKSPKLTKAERSEHASDFVAFWNVYDHKGTSKVQAAKSWARIAPDAVLAAEIIKAATAYVASTPDKTYRKHPATWLNNRCWEVEQPKEPAKKFGNALVGGFDEKGKWHGVGRGPKNYSTPLDEDDPEHPKSILANQNAIRATKGLPPLSGVEEQKILNPGAF